MRQGVYGTELHPLGVQCAQKRTCIVPRVLRRLTSSCCGARPSCCTQSSMAPVLMAPPSSTVVAGPVRYVLSPGCMPWKVPPAPHALHLPVPSPSRHARIPGRATHRTAVLQVPHLHTWHHMLHSNAAS